MEVIVLEILENEHRFENQLLFLKIFISTDLFISFNECLFVSLSCLFVSHISQKGDSLISLMLH